MKLKEKWKGTKKITKVCIIALPIVVIAVVAGVFMKFSGKDEMSQGQWPEMNMMENGMVTATGTTATDMVTKQLDVGSLETTLYVEEVYVSSGDTVKAGDKLFKLTQSSVADAHKELRQKATEAAVAYSQQKVKYEESLIEARKSADITLTEGEYADSTYAIGLANENQSVSDMQEQVAEAKKLAEEYYAAVNSNYYYTYYEVDELQKRVQEPFSYLTELYDKWNIAETEKAQRNFSNSMNSMESAYEMSKYSLYQKFDAAVSVIHNQLEEAKENYEEATEKASYSLDAAQADYELLNAKYQEAVAALEQTKVLLKAECDMAKAEAQLAESTYEATVKQLTEELNQVADENDTAQESLKTFEEMVGDGYLYAQEDGSIMMLNAREGNSLDVNMPYLVYSDSSNVTVSVSVDQSYIAQISVNDSATVMISELGTYEGTVTSINPVSQSDSRSSVYYSVEVTLKGDVSAVTSNLTATVMFMTEEGSQEPELNDIEGAQEKGEEFREGNKPQNMGFGEMEGMPEKPQEEK